MIKKLLTYLIAFLAVFTVSSQNKELVLDKNWTFSQKGKNLWRKAQVPGTIHTDLMANKIIPDPFFVDNEKDLQWIEKEDWEYKTNFKITKSDLQSDKIEIAFEGLDTYAKVFLNNQEILVADNMFRSWTIDVKPFLKEGVNTLYILFESAVNKGKQLASQLSYTLPGEEKVFTRKAQYQYGWDWGPRFVTCGIYKKVKLRFLNVAEIKDIHYTVTKVTDSLATFTLKFDIHTYRDGYYDMFIKDVTSGEVFPKEGQRVSLYNKGVRPFAITLKIPRPKLWWCNGMGEQNFYDYTITLIKKSGSIDSKTVSVGVRSIELVQEEDAIGKSFYFKLNGKPIFMKGANYIPPDNFLSRHSANDYRTDVMLAASRGVNMLRVWGGGTYADEEFYKACDKSGILVWQDFMFACAMYPGDSTFIENVKKEADEQVHRLALHPCIALWCGNNEIDEGWKNWGWQKQYHYSSSDSIKIWNDYTKLFHQVLPAIVKQHAPKTNYITTSPQIGWGHKESLSEGDSHYWGVWWGNEPFEVYEKKVGRFMSEYGFQSLPDFNSIKTFVGANQLTINSTEFKNHQKHPTGFKTIETYMERDFVVPKDFEKYIYVSQLTQARGMQIAIEAHRRARPNCMGTLFWQWNDCWPVTSWSTIDYYKRPKAFYYELSRLYDNVLISIIKSDIYYECHILNDHPNEVKGKIELTVKDFNGKTLYEKQSEVNVKPNSSLIYLRLTDDELKHINKNECYISCELSTDSNTVKKTLYYFVAPKDLKLPKPSLEVKYFDDFGTVKIKSNTLVKNLYIKGLGFTEKNYFDVEPGEEIEITVMPFGKTGQKLTFISLYDVLSEP